MSKTAPNKPSTKKRKRDETPVDAPSEQVLPEAEVCLGSFIASDLPTGMAGIYTRAVRRMLPQHQKLISEAAIMEEADGATLTFEVPSKAAADILFRRLQNARMCGRRWKVQYHPLRATVGAKATCLVNARLVPPGPRALVHHALANVPGFLALAREPAEGPPGAEAAEAAADGDAPLAVVDRVIASFIDEGSALHARAVLSGRLVGSSGARLFLERRR